MPACFQHYSVEYWAATLQNPSAPTRTSVYLKLQSARIAQTRDMQSNKHPLHNLQAHTSESMNSVRPAQDAAPASDQKGRRKHNNKKQPISRAERTLSCVVQALEGQKLLVELRNDMIIRGTLTEADEYMNLSMSDVTCKDLQGYTTQYAFLYVKGRNVRCMHLPKSFNPQEAVEQQRQKLVKMRVASFRAQQRGAREAKGDAGAAYDQEQQQKAAEPGMHDAQVAQGATDGTVQVLGLQSAASAAELQVRDGGTAGQPAQLLVQSFDANELLLSPQPASFDPNELLSSPEPRSLQGLPVQPVSAPHQAGGQQEGPQGTAGTVQVEQDGGEGAGEGGEDGDEEGEMWEEYVEHPLLMTSSDYEDDVGEDEIEYRAGGGVATVGEPANQPPPHTTGGQEGVQEEEKFDFE